LGAASAETTIGKKVYYHATGLCTLFPLVQNNRIHNFATPFFNTSIMHPILEYGEECWDPYKTKQINELDGVQNIAAEVARHKNYLK
jgi:hypothetical protein